MKRILCILITMLFISGCTSEPKYVEITLVPTLDITLATPTTTLEPTPIPEPPIPTREPTPTPQPTVVPIQFTIQDDDTYQGSGIIEDYIFTDTSVEEFKTSGNRIALYGNYVYWHSSDHNLMKADINTGKESIIKYFDSEQDLTDIFMIDNKLYYVNYHHFERDDSIYEDYDVHDADGTDILYELGNNKPLLITYGIRGIEDGKVIYWGFDRNYYTLNLKTNEVLLYEESENSSEKFFLTYPSTYAKHYNNIIVEFKGRGNTLELQRYDGISDDVELMFSEERIKYHLPELGVFKELVCWGKNIYMIFEEDASFQIYYLDTSIGALKMIYETNEECQRISIEGNNLFIANYLSNEKFSVDLYDLENDTIKTVYTGKCYCQNSPGANEYIGAHEGYGEFTLDYIGGKLFAHRTGGDYSVYAMLFTTKKLD